MTVDKDNKPKIGFIGMGHLGSCMALRLLDAGYRLTVYDRKQEHTQPIAEHGADVADSVQALASSSQIVISCVANDAAVEAVMLGSEGVLAGANADTIVIDMSTISPQTSRKIFDAAKQRKIYMIDAAVSGSTPQAKEGNLLILVGGDEDIYQKCKPIFEVLGKQSFYIGGSGMGTTMKLVVNTLLGAGIQVVAEAIALGEKAGIEKKRLLDVLGQMAVISPTHKLKLEKARQNEYPVNFALQMMNKDFGLILNLASELSVAMPATSVAHQICTIEQAKGIEEDHSAVIRLMEELAQLSN
jgi:3-hydroxyisobutyrate dehydrogenase-like beta-hydroxyacid dehydrogenase